MSVERTIYCDADGCETHATTATAPPYLPTGFLAVTWHDPSGNVEFQFCSWDCVLKHAASYEPSSIVPWGEAE